MTARLSRAGAPKGAKPPVLFGRAVWALAWLVAGCRNDDAATKDQPQADPVAQTGKVVEPVTDESRARSYAAIREQVETDPQAVVGGEFAEVRAALREISNDAGDAHLRANAALLLGSLHELRKERAQAIDLYRHASKLVPEDAGPPMVLALALAADGRYDEAVQVQQTVVELDPDNLENWLALGEMRIKAGDEEGGAQAYVDYERRRKGLIDGLTLTKSGNYLVSIDERVACAEALASASDVGTAVALLYALETEPEARVRRAIVQTMGVQRLEGYQHRLKAHLDKEQDAETKEAVVWALAEIDRDPVKAQSPSEDENEREDAGPERSPGL